jgi:TonB family protein
LINKIRLLRNQPLWASVILHAAVLLVGLLYLLIVTFWPKPKPHVFQIISALPQSAQPTVPTAAEVPLKQTPTLPTVTPNTTPESVKQATLQAKPTLTYEQFIKKEGNPKPREQPVNTQLVQLPSIDWQELEFTVKASQSNDRLSDAKISELLHFQTQLRNQLYASWKQQEIAAVNLKCIAVFEVSAAGVISSVRLLPSSGNSKFDASVLEAFKRLSRVQPTPTGRSHQFKMPFRIQ